MRAAIFEAYTGIVTGFKDTPKVDLLLPHVPSTLASGRRTRSSSPFAFSATLRARPQRQFLSAEWLANELRTESRISLGTKAVRCVRGRWIGRGKYGRPHSSSSYVLR